MSNKRNEKSVNKRIAPGPRGLMAIDVELDDPGLEALAGKGGAL